MTSFAGRFWRRWQRLVGCGAICLALLGAGPAIVPSSTSLTGTTGARTLVGFQITGDPESPEGATWTYNATADGVRYDLQGILLKPRGEGPFAAVIISHGAGGNAFGNPRTMAAQMVTWGLVCIAAHYTHAGGVPIGSPGTANEPGASEANLRRAHKLLDVLSSLGYVDMKRVAAHGHSMGAFVTAALVGAYPSDFRVASHTAGAVRPPGAIAGPAPSESQVNRIRVPYQIHHGAADEVVPLAYDERFASILAANGVAHEMFVYPGASHTDVVLNRDVFARIRAWYAKYGVF